MGSASRNLSLILGGYNSLAYLAGSIIPLWSMDRLDRRSPLMISAAGLCMCFVLQPLSCRLAPSHAHMQQPSLCSSSGSSWALDIYLCHGQFIESMENEDEVVTNWNRRFYPSEITTIRIRARGQAFAGFVNWMCVCTFYLIFDPK